MTTTEHPASDGTPDELSSLIVTLHKTEKRLEELTGGEVDTVLDRDGRPYLLRRAQENLRDSEAAMQSAILDALPAKIALLDARGFIIAVNEAWRIFPVGRTPQGPGYSAGLNYLEICEQAHGDGALEAQEVADGIRTVLDRTRKTFSTEYICVSPTEQRCFNLRVVPAGTNQFAGVVVMHIDITERKAADESLRQSEARFRGMFTDSATGIAISTPQGRFLEANGAYCRMLGYTEEELRARDFTSLTHWEDLAPNLKVRDELLSGVRDHLVMEKRYLKKDGATLWARTSVSAVRAAGGAVSTMIEIAEDVTERKKAEAELASLSRKTKRRELLLTTTLSSLTDFAYSYDKQGRFLFANQPLLKLWGRTLEDVVGKNFIELGYPAALAVRLQQQIALVFEKKESVTGETHYTNPMGVEGYYEYIFSPAFGSNGSVDFVVGSTRDITERKRTEQVLCESREHFRFLNDLNECSRNLFDPEQIMTAMTRILGEYLHASRCTYAVVQKDGEHFAILHDYTDGCPSSVGQYQLSLFGHRLVSAFQKEKIVVICNVDTELLAGEGADMFNAIGIKAIISCPLVKDGRLRAIMAVHQSTPRDWTRAEISIVQEVVDRCWATIERRTAEEGLRESEALLRIAGQTARLGGWAVDFPLDRVKWSDEVCAIHEVPVGTEPGLEYAISFYAPTSRNLMARAFSACAETGTPFDLELDLITAKGRTIWVRSIGEAKRNAAGEITRVQGAFQDITERKSAESALRESETRFRQLAAGIDQVFWLLDPKSMEYLYVSPAYERIWGRSEAKLYCSAHEWAEAVHPEDIDRVKKDAAKESNGYTHDQIYRIVRPDGTERWVHDRGFPVPDEKGTIVRVAGLTEDITEKRRLESQFLRGQRMESIGTMAGGIAHDLNNILAPIMMAVQLLRMDMPKARREALISTLESSAKRGAGMVKQVLMFARGVDGERVQLQPQRLLQEIEYIIKETFPRTISIKATAAEDCSALLGDFTQLQQVLLNLCVNARDAMPEGGQLTITASNFEVDSHYAGMNPGARPGPHVVLQVTDTGTGIPQGIIDKIFDPFFTTKEIGHGTGLGLSTLQAIVKSHGGFVHVYSVPKQGTTFKIHLPSNTRAVAELPIASTASLPRGDGELVLVVDDEEPIRLVTRRTLETYGYRVLLAKDGAEAVSLFAIHSADVALVLIDMMMPIMDGPSAIHAINYIRPETRFIASSGLSSMRDLSKGAPSIVKYHLQKPFTADALLQAVRRALLGYSGAPAQL